MKLSSGTMAIRVETTLPHSVSAPAAKEFLERSGLYVVRYVHLVQSDGKPIVIQEDGTIATQIKVMPANRIDRAEMEELARIIQRLWLTCVVQEVDVHFKARALVDGLMFKDN